MTQGRSRYEMQAYPTCEPNMNRWGVVSSGHEADVAFLSILSWEGRLWIGWYE